jgi:hypothetical protein
VRRIPCALAPLIIVLLWSASAHAWEPVATYVHPRHGVATCLRDVGAGRFGLLGGVDRTTTSMAVLELQPDGLAATSTTGLGWLASCPAAAGSPGGGVTFGGPAITTHPGSARWRQQMHAAPAGGAAQGIGRSGPDGYDDTALAVNDAGAAVLAWIEHAEPAVGARHMAASRLLVTTRRAGSATFGPAQVLERVLPTFGENRVVAGIDGSGRATLAWIGGGRRGLNPPVLVATSDAQGAFRVRQTVRCCAISDLALTVNSDGRALLATVSGTPRLYERRPGADDFTELAPLTGDSAISPTNVALGLGPDGEAVVATTGDGGRVSFATRAPGNDFGALRDLTHPAATATISGSFALGFGGGSPSVPRDVDRSGSLSAAVSADRFAVAWIDAGSGGVGAYAAFGSVSGGVPQPERLGRAERPMPFGPFSWATARPPSHGPRTVAPRPPSTRRFPWATGASRSRAQASRRQPLRLRRRSRRRSSNAGRCTSATR